MYEGIFWNHIHSIQQNALIAKSLIRIGTSSDVTKSTVQDDSDGKIDLVSFGIRRNVRPFPCHQIFRTSKIIFQNFDRSSASTNKKREKEAIFLPALLSKGKVQ